MKVQRKGPDRISALPLDTTEKILTLMPIRDAIRTSILSRKWRYSWTTMPKLEFDDSLVKSEDDNKIDKYKLVNAIFHVLLLHTAPILEFNLSVFNKEIFSEIDQIILHLSRSNDIKKFMIEIIGTVTYPLTCSVFSLQGLEHLDLYYCKFEPLLMNKGFSMLKRVRLYECCISNDMALGFLANCPLLEEFIWIKQCGNNIELSESELVELFKCLPSIQVLEITMLHIKDLAAGSRPHKLPFSLVHLRILDLGVCFLGLSSVLSVISSSPNLEKMKLKMCWNHDRGCLQQAFNNLDDLEDYTNLNLDHLKEVEITRFQNRGSWMEFVKLVTGRSPILKKARIVFRTSASVDEEIKRLQDLLRISPTANFIIKHCRW